jgi:amino acid permease
MGKDCFYLLSPLSCILCHLSVAIHSHGLCANSVVNRLINILAVRGYGEAEFWLSGGKLILIFMLFAFTFITMVGGNPKGDAYGF